MIVICLLAVASGADDFSQLQTSRTFTLADQKTVELKVLDWNERKKQFQVENDKGRKVWVSPDSFSEEDQSYFKEWIQAKWFLSNTKLYVSTKQAERGGYVSYDVSIQNKTPVDYSKVTMHYEVERVVDHYETGETKDTNVPGKIFIGLIKSGSRRDFKTQPVKAGETYEQVRTTEPTRVTSGVGYTYTNMVQRKIGREKVIGLRLKFHGPMLNGTRIIREVYIN
jgi:Ni/Co efflux regulator RcnB